MKTQLTYHILDRGIALHWVISPDSHLSPGGIVYPCIPHFYNNACSGSYLFTYLISADVCVPTDLIQPNILLFYLIGWHIGEAHEGLMMSKSTIII